MPVCMFLLSTMSLSIIRRIHYTLYTIHSIRLGIVIAFTIVIKQWWLEACIVPAL